MPFYTSYQALRRIRQAQNEPMSAPVRPLLSVAHDAADGPNLIHANAIPVVLATIRVRRANRIHAGIALFLEHVACVAQPVLTIAFGGASDLGQLDAASAPAAHATSRVLGAHLLDTGIGPGAQRGGERRALKRPTRLATVRILETHVFDAGRPTFAERKRRARDARGMPAARARTTVLGAIRAILPFAISVAANTHTTAIVRAARTRLTFAHAVTATPGAAKFIGEPDAGVIPPIVAAIAILGADLCHARLTFRFECFAHLAYGVLTRAGLLAILWAGPWRLPAVALTVAAHRRTASPARGCGTTDRLGDTAAATDERSARLCTRSRAADRPKNLDVAPAANPKTSERQEHNTRTTQHHVTRLTHRCRLSRDATQSQRRRSPAMAARSASPRGSGYTPSKHAAQRGPSNTASSSVTGR